MATDYTQDANCQGAWLLSEGTGLSAADSSVNSRTMSLQATGHPAWSASVPYAGVDFSLDYTPNDHSDLAARIFTAPNALSVVLWAYVDTPQPSTFGGRMISERSSTGWFFATRNTAALQFFWSGQFTSLSVISSNSSYSTGTWVHFAVTYDGSTTATNVHIYVNGSEVGYATQTNGSGLQDANGANTRFGEEASGSADTVYDGKMAEIGVFDRVLTGSEITDIYTNGLKQSVSSSFVPRMPLLGVG